MIEYIITEELKENIEINNDLYKFLSSINFLFSILR